MKKSAFVIIFLTCSLMSSAQWRIGITGGATYNLYTIDNHYMSDRHCIGELGGTFGFMGQYNFCDWFGVRADLNCTMKDYKQYMAKYDFTDDATLDYRRSKINIKNQPILNWYMQLPIMASFCFGCQKLKGFLNTGIYGGYWLGSRNYDFVEERDQRYDCGFVGGMGLEWHFKMLKKDWAWQIVEARIYYSTKSTQKDYMKIKDPRYNTTLALQSGFCYFF